MENVKTACAAYIVIHHILEKNISKKGQSSAKTSSLGSATIQK